MITIKKIENGGYLDLPNNGEFKLSFQKSNPFLSDMGSSSLPITLPDTPNNRFEVGFKNRIDLFQSKQNEHAVVLSAAGIEQRCKMEVLSGTNVSLLTNESRFYGSIKNETMADVFANQVRTDYVTSDNWSTYFESVMKGTVVDEFRVFPVQTDDYQLNALIKTSSGWKLNTQPQIGLIRSLGVTAFLRLSVVLKKLFLYYGFTADVSMFETGYYADLVVANNTVDTIADIVRSRSVSIYYAHLLPSCSVTEFLDSVRITFGIDFIIERNSVKLVSINSVFGTQTPTDITPLLTAPPEVQTVPSAALNYTSKHFKVPEGTLDIKSWSKFCNAIRKYRSIYAFSIEPENYVYVERKPSFKQSENPEYGYVPSHLWPIFFDESLGNRVYLEAISNSWWYIGDYQSKESILISVNDFDHISTNMAPDQKTLSNPLTQCYMVQNTDGVYIPYVGKHRNMKTNIEIDGKLQDNEECPIMFLFAYGSEIFYPTVSGNTYWANATNRIQRGKYCEKDVVNSTNFWPNNITGVSLIPEGKLGFWEEVYGLYEKNLLNGLHLIKLYFKTSNFEAITLSIIKQLIVNNKKLLPKEFKYEITQTEVKVVSLDCVLLK